MSKKYCEGFDKYMWFLLRRNYLNLHSILGFENSIFFSVKKIEDIFKIFLNIKLVLRH